MSSLLIDEDQTLDRNDEQVAQEGLDAAEGPSKINGEPDAFGEGSSTL